MKGCAVLGNKSYNSRHHDIGPWPKYEVADKNGKAVGIML